MNLRTDLATEAADNAAGLSPEDITIVRDTADRLILTRTVVRSERAEKRLGRPRGRYLTVELPPLTDYDRDLLILARMLGTELAAWLPPEGTVLVAGLGNPDITADSLGPRTARRVLATRQVKGEYARAAGLTDLRSTAVLAPGVCGQTGIESAELIRGVCQTIQPTAVVLIDALVAGNTRHLGRTVQLTDTGIAPGSGVGNHRDPLSRRELGVPVIGMGIPTVVDAATLIRDLGGMELAPGRLSTPLAVTPQEIDLLVRRAARLLAMTIHAALQPNYSPLELLSITE